eukprot:maker-scaffold340_size202118-snap-gene-0.20 protein:Tk00669 transcript:maker-scaffold340_size202118-snap-gene-0.20-mRNA-1 annotation:"conserved hypothetical protein"
MDAYLSPLSIFLVKLGGNGDRILFRYPYSDMPRTKEKSEKTTAENRFAIIPVDHYAVEQANQDLLDATSLISFPNKELSNLFSVSQSLCNTKFELKIDAIRFIGYPISMEWTKGERMNNWRYYSENHAHKQNLSMFHVVIALRAETIYSVVNCYYSLSKMLGTAIRHEERRVDYLHKEAEIMLNAQDEVSMMPADEPRPSQFALALERSQLAQILKKVFDDVSLTGVTEVSINRWPSVSFCLPQRVHKFINPRLLVEPELIDKCVTSIRPYHAILLLKDAKEILECFPLDGNGDFKKIVTQASPEKSMKTLALDCNLPKHFLLMAAANLMYWGKATFIFPVCQTNIYVVSPNVPNPLSPHLMEKFTEKFPGESLGNYLTLFSDPNSIQNAMNMLSDGTSIRFLTQVIVWCLQHHLLVQNHTYMTLFIKGEGPKALQDPLEDTTLVKKDLITRLRENPDKSYEEVVINYQREGFGRTPQSSKPIDDQLREKFDEEEIKELKELEYTDDDVRLFIRCAPYFNGRYHIEEIMFHENVNRTSLLQIIHKFRDVLVEHEHEDPAITSYFRQAFKESNSKA